MERVELQGGRPEFHEADALCAALLRNEWPLLAAPVRAVHARRPVTLRGTASVSRGEGVLARLVGWLARLPATQTNAPVRVILERTRDGRAERWTRWFGASAPMRSTLRLSGACLEERLGLLRMRFRLAAEGGSIRWHVVAISTLGIPWPRSWLDGIEASESVRAGCYSFDVRASLPVIGFLVHYAGVLAVEAQ